MKHKGEPEYKLTILPHTDNRTGRSGHLFELKTIKEFKTYMYDIIVKTEVENKSIYLTIQGISTPGISMPRYGPACFSSILYDLKGRYELKVRKKAGGESAHKIHFTQKKTVLKSDNRKSFIILETTHKEKS